MKRVLLFLCILIIGAQLFSTEKTEETTITMSGKFGIISPSSVSVTINSNYLLSTTFNKDMSTVAITVQKQSGEVVARKVVDAKDLDTVTVDVPPARAGTYIIEISSTEGVLQGKF